MPKLLRRIDQLPAITTGVATITTADSPAPPALGSIGEPTDLVLTATLLRSAVTPSAIISAVWEPPLSLENPSFALQISEDISFPDGGTVTYGDIRQPSMAIEGVKTGVSYYYVRVATVYRGLQSGWTEVVGIDGVDRITTPNDTVPPSEPDAISWDWQADGNLLIRFTPATESNYRDTEVKIWSDSGKSTLYTTGYAAPGFFVWLLAEQRRAQSNPAVLDSAVYIELRSRNWAEYYSSAATPVSQPTKPAPSAPAGLTSSWASETVGAGVAGADCVLSWTADPLIRRWVLTLDGVARDVGGNKYTYSQDTNKAEHSNTPDPTLSVGLVGYDALGQVSPSSSISPTNTAPATTAVSITAGFSAIAVTITPSTAADLRDYTVRIIKDGSTQTTIRSASPDVISKISGKGSYTVGVIVNDLFGQPSTETVSSATTIDAPTIEDLRAEATYTDSIGTDFTTAPNSTVLKDDATGAGITYTSSASAYRSTQVERPFRDRYRRVSAKLGSGAANFYIATSQDGTTWRWFAGVGVDGYTLTERADEATAQANTSLISALTNGWAELPVTVEARYVKLYHRHTSASYRLDEFYAYTWVVADMIRAGDIKTLHLGAGAVTADKMSVLTLSAIVADLGTVTAGTFTGGTVQTATSGDRVVLSSATHGGIVGYASADTYSVSAGTGTYQVLWKKSNGKFYYGGGAGVLDSDGQTITGDSFTYSLYNASPVAPVRANAIEWTVGSGQRPSITGSSSNGQLLMRGQRITLAIPLSSSNSYGLNLQSNGAHFVAAASLAIAADQNTAATAFKVTAGLFASGCTIETDGGLNVGSATGAGTGDVRGSGELQMRGTGAHEISGDLHMTNNGGGTARYLRFYNASETAECLIRDNGGSSVSSLQILPGGTATMVVEANLVRPNSAAGSNLGNATYYWNDVSYKTLTDRGCLALVGEWELGDGRRVSNTQALQALQAHPTERTVYGEVKLDYASVPRHSHKPAPVADEDIYEDDPEDRDAHGKPKRKLKHRKGDRMGEDGVEMTALFSVMIGAIREQADQITTLQATVDDLQSRLLKH